MNAKFQINKDAAGEYRFTLISPNGQTIAVSEGYTTKDNAMNGVASVRENASAAVLDDKTA